MMRPREDRAYRRAQRRPEMITGYPLVEITREGVHFVNFDEGLTYSSAAGARHGLASIGSLDRAAC